jgi:GxxExxY protein
MNRQDAKDAKVFAEPPARADDIARRVIGAAIEVHKHLGPGFLESVYEEALAVELRLQRIPFVRQHSFGVIYKDHPVGVSRPDFYVEDELIVDVKTVEALLPLHTAQVISYLKVANKPLGLLINFKVAVLKQGIKRVVMSHRRERNLGVLGVLAV